MPEDPLERFAEDIAAFALDNLYGDRAIAVARFGEEAAVELARTAKEAAWAAAVAIVEAATRKGLALG